MNVSGQGHFHDHFGGLEHCRRKDTGRVAARLLRLLVNRITGKWKEQVLPADFLEAQGQVFYLLALRFENLDADLFFLQPARPYDTFEPANTWIYIDADLGGAFTRGTFNDSLVF